VSKRNDKKKLDFFHWVNVDKEHRDPPTYDEEAKKLNVHRTTLINWERYDYPEWRKNGFGEYDPDDFLDENEPLVNEALIESCRKGNSAALKIYFQRTGKLIERTENLNIDITARDLARIEADARQRNIDDGFALGEGTVQRQLPVLSTEVREDK
jgi:hypothetical protein